MPSKNAKAPTAQLSATRPARRRARHSPLDRFVTAHHLSEHVLTAQRLAKEEFNPAAPVRVSLEEDPEAAEQWVEIGLSLASDPRQVLEAYDRYTRRWVAAVPTHVVGKVRVAYEFI
jgi:hypothetical protein